VGCDKLPRITPPINSQVAELKKLLRRFITVLLICAAAAGAAAQATRRAPQRDDEFGPNVRIYLEYLRAEQEVVDDRVSRREIDRGYYLLNSNRIRALRQMALRIARETDTDYLPELVAVVPEEFEQLFEQPLPQPAELRAGETRDFKFRYLGPVAVGRHKFHVFARLDPYEQAELRKQHEAKNQTGTHAPPAPQPSPDPTNRPRRVNAP
jgi:hypothetical protein